MYFQMNKRWVIKAFIASVFSSTLFTTSLGMADGTLAGSVSKLKGQLSLENDGGIGQLSAGNMINMQDLLRTGDKTRADLRFLDGSLMTLGDNATLVIDKLVYNPETNNSGGALSFIEGVFHMVSGKIAKSNMDFTITTPTATIGIRGTDFIVIQAGEKLSALLLDNGTLNITTPQGGVTLDKAGQGVDINAIGAPIGDVKLWGQARKDAAIASVSW